MSYEQKFHSGSEPPEGFAIVIADYRDPTNTEDNEFEAVIYNKFHSILSPWTDGNYGIFSTPAQWAYAEELIPELIEENDTLRAENASLQSRLAEHETGRPMETAPKDGSDILLLTHDGDYCLMSNSYDDKWTDGEYTVSGSRFSRWWPLPGSVK